MRSYEPYWSTVAVAVKQAFEKRRYAYAFVVLAALLFLAYYSFLSYFAFGILVFGSLYHVFILVSAIAIGVLLSLVITLSAYSLKNHQRAARQTGVSSIAAVISASLSLCCSTVIPSVLAVVGASTPFVFSVDGKIQGFFSAAEVPLMGLSIALLFLGLYLTSRSVCIACNIKR